MVSTSPTIYAVHEPGLHPLMTNMGVQGWVVTLHELGHNPHDMSGGDWDVEPHTPIARCNHGYGPAGTIPPRELYEDGSTRFAYFVRNSPDCDWFVVGNEWDHEVEWPNGERIYPPDYARYFDLCYSKAKVLRPDAQIGLAAVAPWIPWSSWIDDFGVVIDLVDGYDFVTVHTYTHGHNPELVISEQHMGPPYEDYHYEFRQYRDQMVVIPEGVPVYLTETNPGAGADPRWQNVNNGWVRAAYAEIDGWNKVNQSKQIRCLALYRGTTYDQWEFVTKDKVQVDWMGSMNMEYTWGEGPVIPPVPPNYDKVRLVEIANEMEELAGEVRDIASRM